MRRDSGARHRHGAVWGAVRHAALVTPALAGVTTCVRTSVEHVNRPAGGLPRPQQIVVYDFGVTPANVSLDSAVGARPNGWCRTHRPPSRNARSVARSPAS